METKREFGLTTDTGRKQDQPWYAAESVSASYFSFFIFKGGVTVAEFKHYGVLGMKWGVRKDERRAKKNARKQLKNKLYAESFNELAKKYDRPDRMEYKPGKDGTGQFNMIAPTDPGFYRKMNNVNFTAAVNTVLTYSKSGKGGEKDAQKAVITIEKEVRKKLKAIDNANKDEFAFNGKQAAKQALIAGGGAALYTALTLLL